MWLANAEVRIVQTAGSPGLSLNRSALSAAQLLHALHDAAAWQSRKNVDALLQLFVGEEDQLTLEGLSRLWTALGVQTPAELAAKSDAEVLTTLERGGFGVGRIVSQILAGGIEVRTFLLLGQRFVPDSQVLSSVTYSRAGGGKVRRLMPSPLDVAFASLRNNQAPPLLQAELSKYEYAPDPARLAYSSDGYGEAYWHSNLYTGWLGPCAPSPRRECDGPSPLWPAQLMATEAFGRRLLNTQLGSWAQLRHDTILYAAIDGLADLRVSRCLRRSLSGVLCRADPAWRAGRQRHPGLPTAPPVLARAITYFEQLSEVSRMLGEMAEYERAGRPFADRHLAFVNELVQIHQGCTGFSSPGWYLRLMWDPQQANVDIPTIADVHTDPNAGAVLHVATGLPQLMVTSIDTCQGVRAYAGPVFSYHEVIGADFKRYTDEEWLQSLKKVPHAALAGRPHSSDSLGLGLMESAAEPRLRRAAQLLPGALGALRAGASGHAQ